MKLKNGLECIPGGCLRRVKEREERTYWNFVSAAMDLAYGSITMDMFRGHYDSWRDANKDRQWWFVKDGDLRPATQEEADEACGGKCEPDLRRRMY